MHQMIANRSTGWLGALALLMGTSLLSVQAEDYNDDPALNEFPKRPTPSWVQMVDQGEQNQRLAGLKTPAGIHVEIVAEAPVVIDPVGLTFAEDGTPHVLEWRVAEHPRHLQYEVQFQDGTSATVNRMEKEVRDELKLLYDDDGDGNYERSEVLLDDLEIPSSILLHDDWIYLSSLGSVVRRRQSQPGGAYDVSEEIVRGLCGFHHHQASGLTLSHDGWLYITSGDDDNHGEGSDGSRATVLRCGAIMRCRPDGSQLTEFARGFRNPYRDVSFDHMFNMLHVDNDQEDGSKFQGCRLMHVQEGADYGWRLKQGTLCCRTDFDRGAVFGEKPGRMPSMLKTGRGAPAGLLIYQGTRFPEFFRGLLIYPDVYRKLVRAYQIERVGSTFQVVEEFVLMQSDDPLFRPCQAVLGPDGAIYIVDWRTDSGGAGRLFGDGEHGRIYRLTWSGIEGFPAIKRGSIDAWSRVSAMSEVERLELLDTEDFALRQRVQRALLKRGVVSREPFLAVAQDRSRTAPARAMALGGACYFYDASVATVMRELLGDENFEMRRLAAEALGRHSTAELVSPELISRLVQALEDSHPAVRRSAAMALGKAASLLDDDHPDRRRAASSLYDALRRDDGKDVYLHDGILRGLELTTAAGMDLLVTAALGKSDEARAFAIAELQTLRTRPAVDALNRVLRESDKLTDSQITTVLGTYGQILLEPPIDASEVGSWLRGHPDANVQLKLAAVTTLALTGTTNPEVMLPFVRELIDHPVQEFRLAVIELIGDMHLLDASPALAKALRDSKRGLAERRAIVAVLGRLRQEDLPWANKSPPGVELVVDELAALADDPSTGALRGDLIEVLAAVDFDKTRPIAEAMLEEEDLEMVRSAVRALGANRQQAMNLGQRFVDGQLDRSLLPAVAAVLQKHVDSDSGGEVAALLTEVFRGGLLVSLDPKEVARVEKLVTMTGDAENGRRIYLDSQKSQCAKCHRLEGVGGQVGPDLTKIWETHSVAKILESMIDPSKEIKEGYQTFVITTDGGQVYNGLKVTDDAARVVLRDADGRDITIPKEEIDELEASRKSLMPEGVVSQLSFQEFVDLVAFLKDRQAQHSLRGTATQLWVTGPFAENVDEVETFEAILDPRQAPSPQGEHEQSWQTVTAGPEGSFDLGQAFSEENAAVYALAFLYAPEKQTAKLRLRCNGDARLVLNGDTSLAVQPLRKGHAVPVSLDQGWNTVLLRLVTGTDHATLELVAEGEGLRFGLEPK